LLASSAFLRIYEPAISYSFEVPISSMNVVFERLFDFVYKAVVSIISGFNNSFLASIIAYFSASALSCASFSLYSISLDLSSLGWLFYKTSDVIELMFMVVSH